LVNKKTYRHLHIPLDRQIPSGKRIIMPVSQVDPRALKLFLDIVLSYVHQEIIAPESIFQILKASQGPFFQAFLHHDVGIT
jgi:hypothetical protein